MKLSNCGIECRKSSEINKTYDGPVPIFILAFWDDTLQAVCKYDLKANVPDNLTLALTDLEMPSKAGAHMLNMLAVTLPGSSQFSPASVERITYPQGVFGQRVMVTVQP